MAGHGRRGSVSIFGLLGACALMGGAACAHANAAAPTANATTGSGGDVAGDASSAAVEAAIGEGKYAVESIRSRASIDGIDRLIEISEAGTEMVDGSGARHKLTERGALTLAADGVCQLALAVSVDGEAPGVSERSCSWKIEGANFFLGESGAPTRTVYKVTREGDRFILEGMHDVGPDGKMVGDAKGERIVLVTGRGPLGSQATSSGAIGSEDSSSGPGADEI